MRTLTTAMIVLLAAMTLSIFAVYEPGYILISVGHHSVEMSLPAFTLTALLVIIVAYAILRVLIRVWQLTSGVSHSRLYQRLTKSRRASAQGLLEFAQGDWAQAESLLIQSANDFDHPVVNFLYAAQAAQEQGKYERCEYYLNSARKHFSPNSLVVEVAKAKYQLANGANEEALHTLTRLYRDSPQNTPILRLLSSAHQNLEDWDGLAKLLGPIRKAKIYSNKEFLELLRTVNKNQMEKATSNNDVKHLNQIWKDIPERLRRDDQLVCQYVRSLRQLDQHNTAESILRDALNNSWSEILAGEYGLVELTDSSVQLYHGEAWLRQNPHSGMLLLSLARICERSQLWGKARIYFESSLALAPRPETFRDLGELLDSLGDEDSAQETYRKGLRLAVEGVAEPLRTQAEKYAAKQRKSMGMELVVRPKISSS